MRHLGGAATSVVLSDEASRLPAVEPVGPGEQPISAEQDTKERRTKGKRICQLSPNAPVFTHSRKLRCTAMDAPELAQKYFAEIESYPRLDDRQITELRSRLTDSDTEVAEEAATDLVCSHLRIVVDICHKVLADDPAICDADGKPLTVLDLCFAGNLGLMRASREDDRTVPFAQHAEPFVRAAIAESLGRR